MSRNAQDCLKAVYFYFSSKRELSLSLVREEQENTYYFWTRQKRTVGLRKLLLDLDPVPILAGLKRSPGFFLMMSEMAIRDEEVQEELQATHRRFIDAVPEFWPKAWQKVPLNLRP